MSAVLERREYGPDSTPEEVEAVRSQVWMHGPDIVYWKEVPVMSIWQVEQFGQKLHELIAELDSFSLLIDLTDSKPPNAPIRAELRKLFIPLKERGIRRAAAFTEKNFLINVAAKFVLGGSGLNFSVHTTMEDALAALEGPAGG